MSDLIAQNYPIYVDALLAGNRSLCQRILTDLLNAKTSILDIYEFLIKRSLYQVGEMWESNQISVAREHLATSISETLLNDIYPELFSTKRVGKKIILACVAKEQHTLGPKIIADIFEMHGWDSLFLGANVPERDLLNMINEEKPDVLGLSVSIFFNVVSLQRTLDVLNQTYSKLPVLIGGQAFCWGGTELLKPFQNTLYFPSSQSLIEGYLTV